MNKLFLVLFSVLKKAFEIFDMQKKGAISTDMVGTILSLFDINMTEKALAEVISEVDADGNLNMD